MSGGEFTEVVGYGVRARRDEPVVLPTASLALRVRPGFVAGHVVSGLTGLAFAGVLAASIVPAWGETALLVVGWRAVLATAFAVGGIESLRAGLTWAVAPMLRTEGGRLRWRRPFPSRVVDFDAEELVWRHGAGFVGRYLLTRRRGRSRRIPIWLLPRARQRELFAWLDANVPPTRT